MSVLPAIVELCAAAGLAEGECERKGQWQCCCGSEEPAQVCGPGARVAGDLHEFDASGTDTTLGRDPQGHGRDDGEHPAAAQSSTAQYSAHDVVAAEHCQDKSGGGGYSAGRVAVLEQ